MPSVSPDGEIAGWRGCTYASASVADWETQTAVAVDALTSLAVCSTVYTCMLCVDEQRQVRGGEALCGAVVRRRLCRQVPPQTTTRTRLSTRRSSRGAHAPAHQISPANCRPRPSLRDPTRLRHRHRVVSSSAYFLPIHFVSSVPSVL